MSLLYSLTEAPIVMMIAIAIAIAIAIGIAIDLNIFQLHSSFS